MPTAEDLDQALTTAQAAMAYALETWPQYEAWLVRRFGRIPVGFEHTQAHALFLGTLVDPERMPL